MQVKIKDDKFLKHLKNASKIIKTWPKWKQDYAKLLFPPLKD
jgi:hypothetical protein